jgi:hypothetical protein
LTLAEKVVALHRALSAKEIPHAFGGAIALAYYTLDARGTQDIDINIFLTAQSCEAVLSSLPEGTERPKDTDAKVERDEQFRVFWKETPVDLFFRYDPIHEDAERHSRTVPFAGSRIPVLGPIELAVFKALFDRTQDWADIEAMLLANTLDLEAVRDRLTEMLGSDDARVLRLDDAARRADRERKRRSRDPHFSRES